MVSQSHQTFNNPAIHIRIRMMAYLLKLISLFSSPNEGHTKAK